MMGKNFIVSAILGTSIVLSGCMEKKVEGTSEEAIKKSISEVRDSLEASRQLQFDEAVKAIIFSDIKSFADLAKVKDSGDFSNKLIGKTGEQIIAEGEKIREERKKRELEQARKEIIEIDEELATIEKKLDKAEHDKKELAKFEVVRSKFYYSKSKYSKDLVIEITVKNNTQHAVSRAYFNAVLASPGRSVPWVKESFNYSIAGGLEPGEDATWKLSPNRFGAWSRAPEDRDDMILTATTYRIDGADEKPLYDAEVNERDIEKKERLTARKEKLEASLTGAG